ncbi:MAG: polysaccharide deacetylase family protein [Bacteroidetes bacterium]|nr:polysaccharide deacetylase family protein [Bacteroidota bacterium]MBS1610511.1 polysaccharide deacetylase family protein [Bacteroidota bacterium]
MKLPLHFLLPKAEGIPVLMYHRVWDEKPDRLTITPGKLREQFSFLRQNGYSSISLNEFLDVLDRGIQLPLKSFLLTFDDGYQTHFDIVYPMLKEFSFKATFFIIGNTISNNNSEANPADKKMGLPDLNKLDHSVVQVALHGYNHISFGSSSSAEVAVDLAANLDVMEQCGFPYYKVLAYPYGQRPKSAADSRAFKKMLQEHGIQAAFRIGNKPCALPVKDRFELKRIDISGTDSIKDFTIKLKKGKLKPF